jgi:hypothetical protein
MLSLPWVVERPGMVIAPGLRWFAVDCPPLAIRRVWALTGPLDRRGGEGDVHLIVPRPIGTAVVEVASAEPVGPIGIAHCLVTLPSRLRRRSRRQLEQLLHVAYCAAFSSPAS